MEREYSLISPPFWSSANSPLASSPLIRYHRGKLTWALSNRAASLTASFSNGRSCCFTQQCNALGGKCYLPSSAYRNWQTPTIGWCYFERVHHLLPHSQFALLALGHGQLCHHQDSNSSFMIYSIGQQGRISLAVLALSHF